MSYIPVNLDLSNIVSLLEDNAKCCAQNTKYLLDITNKLNKWDYLISKLVDCKPSYKPIDCGNTGVILPGGPLIGVLPDAKKEIRDISFDSYDTPYYPNSSIIDIPGEYKIVGNCYVNAVGVDLKRYLPYELNIKRDDIILLSIMDYRIVMGGGLYPRKEVLFLYKTKNISTGVINLFEASAGHYRRWYQIHGGIKK
jgi:hypothetical protein